MADWRRHLKFPDGGKEAIETHSTRQKAQSGKLAATGMVGMKKGLGNATKPIAQKTQSPP